VLPVVMLFCSTMVAFFEENKIEALIFLNQIQSASIGKY
jgi:hypothetical protein